MQLSIKLFLFFLLTLIYPLQTSYVRAQGIITTIIGNGTAGFGGDEVLAINTTLTSPSNAAVDSEGNIYIADTGNNRIRKVNTQGIISTIVGNGNADFSGDDSQAIDAALNSPVDVALDSDGNLYIVDNGNNRIRKVNTQGIISTIAGNGDADFTGDGGAAINASLNSPKSISIDNDGNIFIADNFNHRIRRVDIQGLISTVAGDGQAFFSGDGGLATEASLMDPSAVSVDADGNIFIADTRAHRIHKVDGNGIINTVAGDGGTGSPGELNGDDGIATEAQLSFPIDVFADNQGNIFIADQFTNNSIRKVDSQGVITTVAGNGEGGGVLHEGFSGDGGPATEASLGLPSGVFVDGNSNIYIADFFNNRIRKVNAEGIIDTVAGNGDAGFAGDDTLAIEASLNAPNGVVKDNNGNIFVADTENHRIRMVNAEGEISTVAGNGNANFSGDDGHAKEASLNTPKGVAIDNNGNLYIADQINHRIRKVDSEGIISTVAGDGNAFFAGDGELATEASVMDPNGVFVDGDGNVFIADTRAHRIRKIDTNGIINTVAGNGQSGISGNPNGDGDQATNAQLGFPVGVFVDNTGNLFIVDQFNHAIRFVDTNGIISTVAGNGNGGGVVGDGFSGDGGAAVDASLALPAGVFVDGPGNIYIADQFNNVIRKVNTEGIIDTIAGNTVAGFSGDGGSATEATLNSPSGVFVDPEGNILISDLLNHRIRMITPNESPPSVEPVTMVLDNAQIEIPFQEDGLSLFCRTILVRLLDVNGDPVEDRVVEVADITSINSDEEIIFILQDTSRTNIAGNALFIVCGQLQGEVDITFTAEPDLQQTLRVVVGSN